MRILAYLLILAGIGSEAFAWWGLATPAGRRAYDEMDGIIPLTAMPAGLLLIVAGVALLWWIRQRERLR